MTQIRFSRSRPRGRLSAPVRGSRQASVATPLRRRAGAPARPLSALVRGTDRGPRRAPAGRNPCPARLPLALPVERVRDRLRERPKPQTGREGAAHVDVEEAGEGRVCVEREPERQVIEKARRRARGGSSPERGRRWRRSRRLPGLPRAPPSIPSGRSGPVALNVPATRRSRDVEEPVREVTPVHDLKRPRIGVRHAAPRLPARPCAPTSRSGSSSRSGRR